MALVLVIDDDPITLDAMDDNLKEEGYETYLENNADNGIKKAKEKKPDLIICDLKMPKATDGFAALERFRQDKDLADVPFIFLTVDEESSHILKGLQLGAQDYIFKNAPSNQIMVRIKTQIDLKEARSKVQQQNDQLRKKNKELEKLNKIVEAKNKLIEDYRGLASEKVRNHLMVITGRVDMLKKEHQNNNAITKTLEPIERSCNEILEAVEQFLEKRDV